MLDTADNALIASIRVEGLFGLYNYSLPEEGKFSNAAILYGDNGTGKSTLLRLVFHLLSSKHDGGHRGALFEADFSLLEVNLSSGTRLIAKRETEAESTVLKLKNSRQE